MINAQLLLPHTAGGLAQFPRELLEAIDNAIKMGVDIVELDVQRTKDGELILMHDPTLDRTTTERKNSRSNLGFIGN